MKKINVLITGAGTAPCQSVTKGLRQQNEIDVRVTTVDVSPDSAGRYFSRSFYAVPKTAESNFLDKRFSICQKEKQLLIPIVDYEFQKIALLRRGFPVGHTDVSVWTSVQPSPEPRELSQTFSVIGMNHAV